MKYALGNPQGMTINQIIELGNNEHFSKLTCSIIPTIDYWKNLNNRILTELMLSDCDICFEYPVQSIKNAPSSYTDVMLLSGDTVIAVESKWTENIGVLCKYHKAVRKNEVQQHWITIISNYLNKEFRLEQFQEIEYQLLHRVASACSLGKKNCKVVYQIFYTQKRKDDFLYEIRKLQLLLDDPKIEFYVNSIQIDFLDSYVKLKEEIINLYKQKRTEKIKSVIKENMLFHFVNENLDKLIPLQL
jgi:hypothetical protein